MECARLTVDQAICGAVDNPLCLITICLAMFSGTTIRYTCTIDLIMGADGTHITWDNGSRQLPVLITITVLLFFSLIAISLRLYCRAMIVRHVGLDDYFMLAALVVTVGLSIQSGLQISYGTG
jgi:hypothetical protein